MANGCEERRLKRKCSKKGTGKKGKQVEVRKEKGTEEARVYRGSVVKKGQERKKIFFSRNKKLDCDFLECKKWVSTPRTWS